VASSVRLVEIAAQAGVSEATVSRVLNGKPGVSAPTRQAVLAALDILGVERPDRTRVRSAGTVGLITPELDDPIIPAYAQVIERLLTQHGYIPMLCTQMPGGAVEDDFIAILLERGVDGIIFVSGAHADATSSPDRYAALVERGVPIVLINGFLKGVDAPFFSVDDRAGMSLAVRHLTALGHTRLGLVVGPPRFSPVQRKIEGFHDAVAAGGSSIEGVVVHSMSSFEGAQAAAESLLAGHCTAVVCGSDIMALGVVRAARSRGLRVPADVAVVGFDDSPVATSTRPALTSVRQPIEEMGEEMARLLITTIEGSDRAPRRVILATQLIRRASSAGRRVP
jgi:DNA-binding LacI/PurR family transcriptional regulator